MAPPKKMTLQEFFNDESYGGSWADDDVDLTSISVPIEKNSRFSNYKDDIFGRPGVRSGSFQGRSHLSGRQVVHQDLGPPYIVKLSSLPVATDEGFIDDLFRSRYTPYVRSKIVMDPSSNVLESHIIRKIAFVELESFTDFSKVLKWQDLYYKPGKRVITDTADFNDFQNCMAFNKDHEVELQEIENEFVSNKSSRNSSQRPESIHRTVRNINYTGGSNINGVDNVEQPPKLKSNPFGAAKPVDILAKEHEIDKKLITINQTTIKTMGSEEENGESHGKNFHIHQNTKKGLFNKRNTNVIDSDDHRHVAPGIRSSGEKEECNPEKNGTSVTESKKISAASIPSNTYLSKDNGLSLAELLSSKHEGTFDSPTGKGSPTSSKAGTPQDQYTKPIILKKKVHSQSSVGSEVPTECHAEKTVEPNDVTKLDIKDTTGEYSNSEHDDRKVGKQEPEDLVGDKDSSKKKNDERDFKNHLKEMVQRSNAARKRNSESSRSAEQSAQYPRHPRKASEQSRFRSRSSDRPKLRTETEKTVVKDNGEKDTLTAGPAKKKNNMNDESKERERRKPKKNSPKSKKSLLGSDTSESRREEQNDKNKNLGNQSKHSRSRRRSKVEVDNEEKASRSNSPKKEGKEATKNSIGAGKDSSKPKVERRSNKANARSTPPKESQDTHSIRKSDNVEDEGNATKENGNKVVSSNISPENTKTKNPTVKSDEDAIFPRGRSSQSERGRGSSRNRGNTREFGGGFKNGGGSGKRSNRGSHNFNLHYVRKKDKTENPVSNSEQKPSN